MEGITLPEERTLIALWAVIAMAVLVWAVFYFISRTDKVNNSKKSKDRRMKVFYSVMAFVFIWIAILPFLISGVNGEWPDGQGWMLTIVTICFALFVIPSCKSKKRK